MEDENVYQREFDAGDVIEEGAAEEEEGAEEEEEKLIFLRPDHLQTSPAERVTISSRRGERDPAVHALLGSATDEKELHARLATYAPEQWAAVCETLLNQNIDGTSEHSQVLMCFQYFYQLFCYSYRDEIDVIQRIRSIYPTIVDMKVQYSRLMRVFGAVQTEMSKRDFLHEEKEEGRAMKRMLNRAAYNMKMSFDNMVFSRLLLRGNDMAMRAMLEEMTPDAMFREPDLGKLKKHQQLIHFYYRQSFLKGYRKDGDSLYKPRYNSDGDFTCSYELVSDIQDFVFQSIYPIDQNHHWFECLTEKAGTSSHCVNMLTKIKSEWLPNLTRNPMVHSYRNGVFLLDQNVFCWYRPPAGKLGVQDLSGNVTAIKYHDQVFDELGMEAEMQKDVDEQKFEAPHYLSINMGPVDRILTDQGFEPNEKIFIYCFLGRLFFSIGAMDSWGVFLFFFGMAGTGKSTLLRLAASMFEARDVGYMSNTLQKTFALEGIVNKKVYFALDIDGNFQLDQVTWQSMVVGEEVSVTRKFKSPLEVRWVIQGGFAANKLPNWTDNAGSLQRRFIVVELLRKVTNSDPNMFEKCRKMGDRFLKVIISAYHNMAEKYCNVSIKDVLPSKFKESEERAILELNALKAFINEKCDTEMATKKTLIANSSAFQSAFKKFCQEKNIRVPPFTHDMVTPVFSNFRITKVERPEAKKDEFGQSQSYFLGVKLREE